MNHHSLILIFAILSALLSSIPAAAQPSIPKEQVRSEISADLREQITRLYSPAAGERTEALKEIARMGNAARPAVHLLCDMLTSEPEGGARTFVVSALVAIGDQEAVEPLCRALKDDWGMVEEEGVWEDFFERKVVKRKVNHYVRQCAAHALGRFKDKRAVGPLIAALTDDDESVRRLAAYSLGEIGDLSAVPRLIAGLREEKSGFRCDAAQALTKLPDSLAGEALIEAVRDRDPSVRAAAAQALKAVPGRATTRALVSALTDTERAVRIASASSLGALHDETSLAPLKAALAAEKDAAARQALEQAIGAIPPGSRSPASRGTDARAIVQRAQWLSAEFRKSLGDELGANEAGRLLGVVLLLENKGDRRTILKGPDELVCELVSETGAVTGRVSPKGLFFNPFVLSDGVTIETKEARLVTWYNIQELDSVVSDCVFAPSGMVQVRLDKGAKFRLVTVWMVDGSFHSLRLTANGLEPVMLDPLPQP